MAGSEPEKGDKGESSFCSMPVVKYMLYHGQSLPLRLAVASAARNRH